MAFHMELPVAKSSYEATADVLVRAVGRAAVVLGRAAAEPMEIDGAVCFCDPARPAVRCANFAAELSVPEGRSAAAVVDDVLAYYESRQATCEAFASTAASWPKALAEELITRGYEPVTRHLFLLDRAAPPPKAATDLQIIPARAAYEELRKLYGEMARLEHGADGVLASALVEAWIDHLDEPRFDLLLGRAKAEPVVVAGVLSLGQVGVISAAYCHPSWRGRGFAQAIMGRVLEYCSRATFEQIIVDRGAGCPAIPFYESLGFHKKASFVRFKRREQPSTS
jgi:GNAT superfamily N-acetyltransferase